MHGYVFFFVCLLGRVFGVITLSLSLLAFFLIFGDFDGDDDRFVITFFLGFKYWRRRIIY